MENFFSFIEIIGGHLETISSPGRLNLKVSFTVALTDGCLYRGSTDPLVRYSIHKLENFIKPDKSIITYHLMCILPF